MMNENLIKAIIRQSGGKESFAEMAQDIVDHGADAGFSGWIYYSDTVDFFIGNRKNIMAFAKESAEDMGMSMFEMIKGFGVFRGDPASDEEIAEALYDRNSDDPRVRNVMAWFVLEEYARIFVEEQS
jgi:hypothetical protein